MKIHIDWSDNQTKYKTGFLLRYRLKKAIRAALKYEKFSQDVMVSVSFTDNEGIRELNREYRNKDAATDVLSFPMYTMEEDDRPEPDMAAELGDIVLSLERAGEQAEEYGHGIKREIGYLTVHSVLHLLGYDHLDEGPMKRQMRRQEETIMAQLLLTR